MGNQTALVMLNDLTSFRRRNKFISRHPASTHSTLTSSHSTTLSWVVVKSPKEAKPPADLERIYSLQMQDKNKWLVHTQTVLAQVARQLSALEDKHLIKLLVHRNVTTSLMIERCLDQVTTNLTPRNALISISSTQCVLRRQKNVSLSICQHFLLKTKIFWELTDSSASESVLEPRFSSTHSHSLSLSYCLCFCLVLSKLELQALICDQWFRPLTIILLTNVL